MTDLTREEVGYISVLQEYLAAQPISAVAKAEIEAIMRSALNIRAVQLLEQLDENKRLREALDGIANTLCDTAQYLNDDLVKHAFEVAEEALEEPPNE